MMEFLQLKYFECIAKYESVSRAAEELHISQPSLSSSLLRLENELGAQLFDRKGRKLALNSYGRFFLSNTRKILGLLQISRAPGSREAVQRLGIGFQNYNEKMMKLIDGFMELHPEITVETYGSTLNRPFDTTHYDFIVGNAGTDFSRPMQALHLESRSYYVVLPQSHPMAAQPFIHLSGIAGENFCFLKDDEGRFEHSYHFCIEEGFIPRCVYSSNSSWHKLRYMAKGRCVTIIPQGWTGIYESLPGLCVRPLSGFENRTDILLFWEDTSRLSPIASQFLSYVQQRLRQVASPGFSGQLAPSGQLDKG